jgi:hypothetical protein
LIDFFENPHIYVHTSATTVKKDMFYETQGFPVGMKMNEDYACFFSIAMITDVVYNGYPLSIYRGNIANQATSIINNDESIKHVIDRFNLCYYNWTKTEKKRTFLIFMKYEIRHIILANLRRHDDKIISYIINNLTPNVKNHFSNFEWLLYEKYSKMGLYFIYFTKIIWRMHGYPRVNYK